MARKHILPFEFAPSPGTFFVCNGPRSGILGESIGEKHQKNALIEIPENVYLISKFQPKKSCHNKISFKNYHIFTKKLVSIFILHEVFKWASILMILDELRAPRSTRKSAADFLMWRTKTSTGILM
jgi:hypothetical protein